MEVGLYAEIYVICILIVLFLGYKSWKSKVYRTQGYYFMYLAFTNVAFYITDLIWKYVDGKTFAGAKVTNWLVCTLYYWLVTTCTYICIIYAERINEFFDKKRNQRFICIASIPLAGMIVLLIFNYWTRWLFYIDGENVYHRGSAYFIHPVVNYGYMILAMGICFYHAHKSENFEEKRIYKVISYYVCPGMITGVLQVILPGYPVLSVGTMLSMLVVYVHLQEWMISVDPLTQVHNRNRFQMYVEKWMKHASEQGLDRYFMIVDMDDFKSINDTYGHAEGDYAIRYVAECIKRACVETNSFISRYGGDEFIILYEDTEEQGVEELCNKIHTELDRGEQPYRLGVSFGVAKCTNNDVKWQDLFVKADERLYIEKKNKKIR